MLEWETMGWKKQEVLIFFVEWERMGWVGTYDWGKSYWAWVGLGRSLGYLPFNLSPAHILNRPRLYIQARLEYLNLGPTPDPVLDGLRPARSMNTHKSFSLFLSLQSSPPSPRSCLGNPKNR